jgi:CDP-diacylglycerol--glycerol-3-phosphate 3-phosphatidyltransferase
MSDGSLLSNERRNRFRAIVQPYAAGLARVGLTPNMLTLIGFGIAIVAAALAGLESWFWAGIVSVVAGSFDMLDGAVARATGKTSKFGAFMDSTFDRWGEGVIYVGIVGGGAAAGSQLTAMLAVLAAVCAFMVSYTRAKAEGLGFKGEVGIAPRPERIVILGIGLVAAGLTGGPGASIWLQLALGAIVVLTTVTVIQRILHVRRQAAAESTSTKP